MDYCRVRERLEMAREELYKATEKGLQKGHVAGNPGEAGNRREDGRKTGSVPERQLDSEHNSPQQPSPLTEKGPGHMTTSIKHQPIG